MCSPAMIVLMVLSSDDAGGGNLMLTAVSLTSIASGDGMVEGG